MNKGLAQLFDKLSKTEKRYISHSFDSNKHRNLISLYSALSSGNKVSSNSTTQHRLLDFILERLTQFHQAELIDQSIMNELSKSKILYRKELKELSKKYLSKAKSLALKNQRFLMYQQLIEFELFCFKDDGEVLTVAREKIKNLREQEVDAQNKQNLASIGKFYAIDYLLISRNRISPDSGQMHASYKDVLKTLSSMSEGAPVEFKICLHNIRGMYHFTESDFLTSGAHFQETAKTIESFQDGIDVFRKEYFFALNNLLMTYGLTKQKDNYALILEKIKAVFGKNKKFEKELFSTTMLYEVGFSAELGEYEKVIAFEETILQGIENFEINIINRQLFFINLSVSFLALNQMAKAHKYAVQIITDTASKRIASNSNIYFYAHFVALITQFEKGEYDFMKYALQSTSNHLKRVRAFNLFDKRIIKLLKQLSNHPEKRKELSKALLNDTDLMNSKEATFAHQFFDFSTWLKSNIQNRTMNDIRKELELKNTE